MSPVIALFTDFGIEGPYVGQVKAVLAREAPDATIIDLCHDLAPFNPRAAAYLLPAYASSVFAVGTVFMCVVDPGVGKSTRQSAAVRADGRWFIGPDNGLFNEIARRAGETAWWDITWRPDSLSASFHGRDLFAPVSARISNGEDPPGTAVDATMRIRTEWPKDLAEVAYLDHYGNAVTGLRANQLNADARLSAAGQELVRARTFSDVSAGEAFWYENANGLVEIAVNRGSATNSLGLTVGAPVKVYN